MPMGASSAAARRNSCVAFSSWPFSCNRIPFCIHRSCRSAASCIWSVSWMTADCGFIIGAFACASKTVESARRISGIVVLAAAAVLLLFTEEVVTVVEVGGCCRWSTVVEIRFLAFFKSCEARLLLLLLLLSVS